MSPVFRGVLYSGQDLTNEAMTAALPVMLARLARSYRSSTGCVIRLRARLLCFSRRLAMLRG